MSTGTERRKAREAEEAATAEAVREATEERLTLEGYERLCWLLLRRLGGNARFTTDEIRAPFGKILAPPTNRRGTIQFVAGDVRAAAHSPRL